MNIKAGRESTKVFNGSNVSALVDITLMLLLSFSIDDIYLTLKGRSILPLPLPLPLSVSFQIFLTMF